MWHQWLQWWKDRLFPLFCVSCGREGEWWCPMCMAATAGAVQRCPMCGVATVAGVPCAACAVLSPLDALFAAYDYSERGAVGTLIKLFKFNYAASIDTVWQRCVFPELVRGACVVPVPLHARRERERGYNQAMRIARSVAASQSLPMLHLLQRTRYTRQQAKLGRVERFRNIQDAFTVTQDALPSHVVLVDDVFTTGATMQECARVLKAAGVAKVEGLVIARG